MVTHVAAGRHGNLTDPCSRAWRKGNPGKGREETTILERGSGHGTQAWNTPKALRAPKGGVVLPHPILCSMGSHCCKAREVVFLVCSEALLKGTQL